MCDSTVPRALASPPGRLHLQFLRIDLQAQRSQQTQAANEAAAAAASRKKDPTAEDSLWEESVILDVTDELAVGSAGKPGKAGKAGKAASGDAGLVAVPVP